MARSAVAAAAWEALVFVAWAASRISSTSWKLVRSEIRTASRICIVATGGLLGL